MKYKVRRRPWQPKRVECCWADVRGLKVALDFNTLTGAAFGSSRWEGRILPAAAEQEGRCASHAIEVMPGAVGSAGLWDRRGHPG